MKIANVLSIFALISAAQFSSVYAAPDDALACGGTAEGNVIVINRTEAKCKWPFDVQEMKIRCDGIGHKTGAVYFGSEKGTFGLNGKAKQTYRDPRPIWLDIDQPGMGKIDVGPWIKVGLELC